MSQRSQDQSLLRQVIESALGREESGYPPMTAHETAAPAEPRGPVDRNDVPNAEGSKLFTVPINDPEQLIPQHDKLLMFRALTGIDSVPALTQNGHIPRTAPNVGIYTRVVTNEKKAARSFRLFNYLINICLGIQIVVAAALTALGAASGPHSAVTAFGAINTIMAGFLTYLRGSGLPDRLKDLQKKWKHIREHIELRERKFCLVGCDLDVEEEVFIVESMYQRVKSEVERTKRSGDSTSQQPDDSRNRRSLLPTSHEPSGHITSATPAKRSDVLSPRQQEEPVGPITAPEPVLEKTSL